MSATTDQYLPHDRLRAGRLVLAGMTALLLGATANAQEEPPDEKPAPSIVVKGVVRDFKERTVEGGHPDMEAKPAKGFGRYSGNIAEAIGADRKPVFTGTGRKVASQWRDSQHRQICHRLYDPALGDVEGNWSQAGTGGISSAASFNQWYDAVPSVNLSAHLSLTLYLQEDGHYVFDDRTDPLYAPLGGFFPIDDQLFGNPDGSSHNFHFTFELHLDFEYNADGDQFFMFIGDDDVWVYIDDKLVIDLGGVHAAHDQYVELDRLGLENGETYTIDFFFAERYRPQSNFRLETNIPVHTGFLPPITVAYD